MNASGAVTRSSRAVSSSMLAGGQRATHDGQIDPRADPKPLGNSCLMKEGVNEGVNRNRQLVPDEERTQRSFEVIRGDLR